MNYWLVKSEPVKYPFEKLIEDKSTLWDGVRNYAARNNLQAMKKGDHLLYYHSNEGKAVVGIAKVVKESYQDPTTDDPNWVVVEIAPVKKLKNHVTLEQIKSDKVLKGMEMVRLGRLSVTPVRKEEFDRVLELSEKKA